MTRARWLIGTLIGVAALIISIQGLVTYVAERLVVGAVAVAVLVGVLAVGFASLARARQYIAREISALGAQPPAGALYQARRAQLVALHQRGVSPDLDLLADETAAAEAERGYTGKYLVATTVLIGLVGTFGGLMETLARAAPLLKGDLPSSAGGPAGALALIAGPLAGLHVTFGTSVVAIVVTLALALVQGDVTLQHERLLALLQERTRHVLVPELWPADDSIGERTVRALVELRAFVAESLTTGTAASAEKIAGVVRGEVQRLVAQLRTETQAAGAAQTAALERASADLTEGFRRTMQTAAQELRDAGSASRDTMTAAATASREVVVAAAAASQEAFVKAAAATRAEMATAAGTLAAQTAALERTSADLTEELRRTMQTAAQELRDSANASRETLAQAATASREVVAAAAAASQEAFVQAAAATREETAAAVASLAATTARTSESVAASTEAAVASLGELRGSLSAQLEGASQALATAAADLQRAAGSLSPAIAELAPQLAGLTAEIALLVARADSPEEPNAVLDELVRLSEDVERLLASTQQPAVTTEVAAREAES